LLFIKEKGADPQQWEAWNHKGGAAFASQERPTQVILPMSI